MTRVQGYCPACGGESLFLADEGYITCSRLGCPKPTAVSDLLADCETEHIVVFDEGGFVVQHPMRERLEAELFECGLHRDLIELHGPPVKPGRYRVSYREHDGVSESFRSDASRWHFEDVSA